MLISNLIFIAFAITLIGSALMVVAAQHPVRSALFLVLTFFAASGLWMMLEAEFLSLVLILVYVGAVMTLFLFVVMTLNIDLATLREPFLRFYMPLGLLLVIILVSLMYYVIGPAHSNLVYLTPASPQLPSYSNTEALGTILYTDYAFPLEITGILLLAVIIAAISLCVRGVKDSLSQKADQQIVIRREDRVRIVKMPSTKK